MPATPDECSEILLQAFFAARQAIDDLAHEDGGGADSFATTLVLAIAARTYVATAHVGDGLVAAWVNGDDIVSVSPPERHEFLNLVTPITVPNLRDVIRLSRFEGVVNGVALLTDGLQDLTMNMSTNLPFAGFFRPLFAQLAEAKPDGDPDLEQSALREFLCSEAVNRRTSDDKTLLWAIWQKNGDASLS